MGVITSEADKKTTSGGWSWNLSSRQSLGQRDVPSFSDTLTITAKPQDETDIASPAANPQPVPNQPGTTNKPAEVTKDASDRNRSDVDPESSPQLPDPVSVRPEAFETLLDSKIETNLLNDYYSPTYHFRLFMAGDADMIEQANNPKSVAALIGAIADKSMPQITIAESGVTGFTIKDVEIETVNSTNAITSEQMATTMTITVVEPLGISFLDGFLASSKVLGVKNFAQTHYYLELTFTGYNADGTATGRPIKFPYRNGGRWIWSIIPQQIETKITEGGGTYTLKCYTPQGQVTLLANETKKLSQGPQTIKVSGNTLGELFDNYATQITKSWNDAYSKNGKKLRTYAIKVQKVQLGPNREVDISAFRTKSSTPDQSSSRMLSLEVKDGKMTAQVPPGMSANDFIVSAIKATEEGQALIKDLPVQGNTSQSSAQVNDRKVREPTVFSIDLDQKRTGYDKDTGNYTYDITIIVVPKYAPAAVVDNVQVKNARDPAVQRQMLSNVVNNGLLRKKYEYIFTGKNTEVIDFNISFNLPWQPLLPKLAGARLGYNNEAVNARLNEVNKKGDTVQSAQDQQVSPQPIGGTAPMALSRSSALTDLGPGIVAPQPTPALGPRSSGSLPLPSLTDPGSQSNPISQQVANSLDNLHRKQLEDLQKSVETANNSATPIAEPSQPRLSNSETTSTGEASKNIYMEDLLDRVNQNDNAQLNDLPIPISFWQGYQVPEEMAGKAMSGSWGRDQSVVGAIFAQIYGTPLTAAFQQLDPLTIRGDPFWLGQSNLERQLIYRSGLQIYDPLGPPDHATSNKVIYLYFRYPLQIGADFNPVLKKSESFNGLYEILRTKHIFSDGVYKTELRGNRLVLFNVDAAMTGAASGGTGSSGNGSSSQLATSSGPGGNKGATPGPGAGFTLTPSNLPDSTAKPTDVQSSDQTTLGNLSASQLASYKAAIGQSESRNNPGQGNNGVGYVGQYQFGHDALTQLGYITPEGNKNDPMSWTWTNKNGVTSLSDWLANPNLQNSAMNSYTQSNYNSLVNQGAITNQTSPETVAGLLGAAHLAGAGGAARWASSQGSYSPSDAFGTEPGKYYNLGYNAARLAPSVIASQ